VKHPPIGIARSISISSNCFFDLPNKCNRCLFNTGPAPPDDPSHARGSVILGLSGDPHKLVHVNNAHADGVPLVKRYSGGGTVFLDNGCRMVSLLINTDALPNVQPYPRNIMDWTGRLYGAAFTPHLPTFHLRENDYCIGSKKVAGNAQSITRGRWCHVSYFCSYSHFDRSRPYLSCDSSRFA
jgi:lipoate-protein ligase A